MKKSLNLAALFVAAMLAALSQSASAMPNINADLRMTEELVKATFRAYGGADAIKNLKTVHAHGDIKGIIQNDGGVYERYFTRDRKLRVEMVFAGSGETRILNGDKGWRVVGEAEAKEASGQLLQSMVYQYKQYDVIYGILNHDYKITDLGPMEHEGKKVDVLILQDAEGPPMRIYIDLESLLVTKVEGFFETKGAVMKLASEFADYKPVEGVMMPFRITNYANGKKVAETTITKCEANTEMAESLFTP